MENRKRVGDIPYKEILKKSLRLAWKNKFLWWFGFFIALGAPGSISLNLPGDSSDIPENSVQNFIEPATNFLHQYIAWILIGSVVIFAIFLTLYALGKIGRGALIKSVEKINRSEPAKFKSGWADGKKYFWKILGLDLLLSLSLTALILIIIAPLIILFIYKAYILGALLLLPAFLFIITLSILISFLRILGRLYAVMADLSIWNSIEKAYILFRKNIWPIMIMSLINSAVGIAVGLPLLLLLFTFILVGIALGLAIYAAFKLIGVIVFCSVLVLIFLAIAFLARALIEVFFQTVWILFFQEIATQPKAEESATEPVLEKIVEAKPSESVNMTKS